MLIETFPVGTLSTNCYVVNSRNNKEAIIIDPGLDSLIEAEQIFEYIKDSTVTKIAVPGKNAIHHDCWR